MSLLWEKLTSRPKNKNRRNHMPAAVLPIDATTAEEIKKRKEELDRIKAEIEQLESLGQAREKLVKLGAEYKFPTTLEFLTALGFGWKAPDVAGFIGSLSEEDKKVAKEILKDKKSNGKKRPVAKGDKDATNALLKEVWSRNPSASYQQTLDAYLGDEAFVAGKHIRLNYQPALQRIKKFEKEALSAARTTE